MKVAGTVSFPSHDYQWNPITLCKIIRGITSCPTPLDPLYNSQVDAIILHIKHKQLEIRWNDITKVAVMTSFISSIDNRVPSTYYVYSIIYGSSHL